MAKRRPALPRSAATKPKRQVARVDLKKANADLKRKLMEARGQLTATTQVLHIINASSAALEPVFGAVLEKAMRLCQAAFGFVTIYDGQRFIPVAQRNVPKALSEYFATGIDEPRAGDAHSRLLAGEDIVHNLDQKNEDAYRAGNPLRRAVVDLGGARTALVVALRKESKLLGALKHTFCLSSETLRFRTSIHLPA
jgi:hypothetical protein